MSCPYHVNVIVVQAMELALESLSPPASQLYALSSWSEYSFRNLFETHLNNKLKLVANVVQSSTKSMLKRIANGLTYPSSSVFLCEADGTLLSRSKAIARLALRGRTD